jgi:hypothetical protein
MQRVQAARACRIDSNTWPQEVIEPANAVRRHGMVRARGKILGPDLAIAAKQGLVLGARANVDRRLGARCFLDGDTSCDWCGTTSVNTAEQHPTWFAGHPHRSLALDTRTQEDLAAEGLGNWLLPG